MLCRFPALQHLDVSACRRVSDEELANLSQMPNLKSVVLSGCDDISDEGMLHLAQLTKLTSLNMSNCCKVSTLHLLLQLTPLTNLNTPEMLRAYERVPVCHTQQSAVASTL